MKTIQQGFTLIELMIVVAIIGILAAIAIPQYNDYVARSQASAGLSEISGGKTAYEERVQRGAGVTTADEVGLSTSTNRCTIGVNDYTSSDGSVGGTDDTMDGGIHCTLKGNPSVTGQYVEWERTSAGDWNCETDLDADYRPEGCT